MFPELANFAEALAEIAGLLPWSEARTPQPGELFQARATLKVRARLNGHADAYFVVVVPKSTTVMVSHDHLSRSGDVLVAVHTDGHLARVPRKYQAVARVNGYLLVIPTATLRKSFRQGSR